MEVTALSDTSMITVGHDHACALKEGGVTYCWGSNSNGQLGLSGISLSKIPIQVTSLNGKTIKHIFAGFKTTFFIADDGSVYGCGDNSNGRLGLSNLGIFIYFK